MADLSQLQQRLDRDAQFRKQFLENPVATLEGEGVQLTDAMKTRIKEVAKAAAAQPGGATTASVSVGVSVGVG